MSSDLFHESLFQKSSLPPMAGPVSPDGSVGYRESQGIQKAPGSVGLPSAEQPVPSPRCAMEVSLTEGAPPQLVHVPFLQVSDPDFVAGYAYGAGQDFADLWDDEEEGQARAVTDRALITELGLILQQARRGGPAGLDWQAWTAWVAGFLAGWISARIPSPFPLYGNCLHCHQPADACGGCPRCGTCTCASEPGTRGTADAS
jgi:hypothetical protein